VARQSNLTLSNFTYKERFELSSYLMYLFYQFYDDIPNHQEDKSLTIECLYGHSN
jgi:hypothetical protein